MPSSREVAFRGHCAGADSFEVLAASEAEDAPMAVVIEERRQPVGAVEFDYFGSSRIFKINRIVDGDCQPIEAFKNASRDGDRHVLQDWETVEMTIGADIYALRLGYKDGAIEGTLTRIK